MNEYELGRIEVWWLSWRYRYCFGCDRCHTPLTQRRHAKHHKTAFTPPAELIARVKALMPQEGVDYLTAEHIRVLLDRYDDEGTGLWLNLWDSAGRERRQELTQVLVTAAEATP